MNSLLLIPFLTVVMVSIATGDMGSIPFNEDATISEPRQDAIIAWNGAEQLLYLQTTLAASEETRVLEVMPLPSKPSVAASDEGVFKRCAFLMPRPPKGSPGRGHFGDAPESPAAEVVERKLLAAHDLRIVRLLDADRFAAWVREEFVEEGLEAPQPLLEVVDEYARDGFRWFLFDVVDVATHRVKKTPLRIRFETDHLYYPMRITRTEKGKTTVSLSVLTNVLFNSEDCVGLPRDAIAVPARPKEIPGGKIRWIDPPLFELLGRPRTAKLRSWRISGEIDAFEKDLLIRAPDAVSEGKRSEGSKRER